MEHHLHFCSGLNASNSDFKEFVVIFLELSDSACMPSGCCVVVLFLSLFFALDLALNLFVGEMNGEACHSHSFRQRN
jgi:hypothetical protein